MKAICQICVNSSPNRRDRLLQMNRSEAHRVPGLPGHEARENRVPGLPGHEAREIIELGPLCTVWIIIHIQYVGIPRNEQGAQITVVEPCLETEQTIHSREREVCAILGYHRASLRYHDIVPQGNSRSGVFCSIQGRTAVRRASFPEEITTLCGPGWH